MLHFPEVNTTFFSVDYQKLITGISDAEGKFC